MARNMKLPVLIIAFIGCLLGGWAVGAAYFFAPDLFAQLDVSDIFSGFIILCLAVGGNITAAKVF